MQPDACHSCGDNPLKEKVGVNRELSDRHAHDLALTQRLFTATRLGLLQLSDLREDEFEKLSAFYWEWERLSRGAKNADNPVRHQDQ